jgi:hypothetical protein
MSDISFHRDSPLSNIVLITGESQAGAEWLAENVQAERWGGSIWCDVRMAAEIAEGAADAGLEVE